jgi:hypothetical protein
MASTDGAFVHGVFLPIAVADHGPWHHGTWLGYITIGELIFRPRSQYQFILNTSKMYVQHARI